MLIVIKEVERYVPPSGKTDRRFLCQCDCGKQSVHHQTTLRSGKVKSCGCQRSEVHKKHGCNTRRAGATATYSTWKAMRQRCNNSESSAYKYYGARGIKICDRWQDEDSGYTNFLQDMGEKPSKQHSLDRIDVNGNYCPENCRWATPIIQANNTRSNRRVRFEGKLYTLAELSREKFGKPGVIASRLAMNWTVTEAATTPIKESNLYLFEGEYLNASQISKRLGGDRRLVYNRLKKGWTIQEAISIPESEP